MMHFQLFDYFLFVIFWLFSELDEQKLQKY